jgi:Cu(I)/Ag(I) efflux system membrane fusion protein/cobalt-zinc-cadmium efflux system membrane fusion protein
MGEEGEEKEAKGRGDPLSLPPPTSSMKAFSLAVFFLIGFGAGAFLFWNPFAIPWLPGGPEKHLHTAGDVPPGEVVQTGLWTCPMHPEVVEPEPGDCPICHMKLVPLDREPQPTQQMKVDQKSPPFWTCPMHPEVVEQEPGKCPICHMKLVELSPGDEAGEDEEILKIDPAIVQQIGVRTEKIRVGELRSVIRTVGILDYNEKNIFLVNTKFDGWIEKVYVNYIGEKVRRGGKLFEIYSPELVSTQEEYVTALRYHRKMKETGSPEAVEQARALTEATRKRLAYWDVDEAQIKRLEATGEVQRALTVVSPATGVVVEKMEAALEGMYAKSGMNLYKIADLSTVWVHADIYESELPRVQPGLEAEVTLSFVPGRTFVGEVLFLQPFLGEKTRTVKACIEIENKDGRLEPGMYAEVKIKPVTSKRAVLVPEDAVIRTGEKDLVFLDLGEGRFLPRAVELGMKGEGVYEVKKGLLGEESVVVSAQFLLDSESRLQAFIRKLVVDSKDNQR